MRARENNRRLVIYRYLLYTILYTVYHDSIYRIKMLRVPAFWAGCLQALQGLLNADVSMVAGLAGLNIMVMRVGRPEPI